MQENKKNMTLKDYFESLPKRETPRKTLIDNIINECGVTSQTARNWCIYGIKPKDFRHVRILSRLTGIREEELWDE